jgi:hypothetical protein
MLDNLSMSSCPTCDHKEQNCLLVSNLHHPEVTDFESVNSSTISLVIDVQKPIHELMPNVQSYRKKLSAGFEPAPPRRNRFYVIHLAKTSEYKYEFKLNVPGR